MAKPNAATTESGPSAFLCYRSENVAHTRHVRNALISAIGANRVFWDMDTIGVGENYVDRVEKGLATSSTVVVIIGQDWLQTDGSPDSGINDPADPVRMELRIAIQDEKQLLPVLVDGAVMPARKSLPEDISRLEKVHALRLSEDHWDEDLQSLVNKVRSMVDEPIGQRRLPARTPAQAQGTGQSSRQTPARSPSVARPTSAPPHRTGPQRSGRPDTARLGRPSSVPLAGSRPSIASMRLLDSSTSDFIAAARERHERWINSPEAEAMRERVRKEQAAKEAARAAAPAFYERAEFWITAAATVVACIVFALAADSIVRAITRVVGINLAPVDWGLAPWLVGLTWAAIYVGGAVMSYVDDPRDGASVFVTKGAFGWISLLGDDELGGALFGAFPITIILGWLVARALDELAKSQASIPWFGGIALTIYTIYAAARYTGAAADSF